MKKEIEDIGARALRKLAVNPEIKKYILQNDEAYFFLKKAAERYIAGENVSEAVPKALLANESGLKTSLEYIGEDVQNAHCANLATQEFIGLAKEIVRTGLKSAISLDLSHIGLKISKELCLENLLAIGEEAKIGNIEVFISAENTEKTDDILEIYKKAQKKSVLFSITLQAYLYRSKDDLPDLLQYPGTIRLVKGAFITPKGLSIPRGKELNKAYLRLVEQVLAANHKCSIATHDDSLHQEVKKIIQRYQISKNLYEFEGLHGVQRNRLEKLKTEGYPTKIYMVYGREWYLYLLNRLAEKPENIFQALDDISR